jgi:hypothetical protein
MFTLMSAAGSGAVGAALDASLALSDILWWMAGLILAPAVLWSLWLITDQRRQPVGEEPRLQP